MPYLKEPKLLEITFFSLALQSLPLKLLAPKAALSGANTNAAPLREAARFVKLLKNVLARKLFGRYGIKGFGFLNSFASAKLNFNKLFEKFWYRFRQLLVNGPYTIIGVYRYTGVNGIVLICLTTKIAAIKYRTFRIIIFKKGQINKIPIIALLEIDNFLRRKRVADIYIKRKKGNQNRIRIRLNYNNWEKYRGVAKKGQRAGWNRKTQSGYLKKYYLFYERPNTDYLRLQSLKLLKWLLNVQKGKKRAVSGKGNMLKVRAKPPGKKRKALNARAKPPGKKRKRKRWQPAKHEPPKNMPANYRYRGQSIIAKLKNKVKFKLHESVWNAKDLKNRPRVPERARGRGKLKKEQFLLAIALLLFQNSFYILIAFLLNRINLFEIGTFL
ncbi:hypothetical protein GGTG_04022 [Gaeumannomyces tritici R3-111a-1]|uniref:Uncharacterized protein n=1 Tax=Gaeumannomyces tritici (strain R3-111a-1) TaxID=644352 RepID=J3NRX4_GAET3|nr:hypothetical protein GGTG_04022 [Gaeumannomyces tritici R3-111a-1]EJT78930.1 hypothetical protein GGTG_04022 [Gaeumannomyces tritici R3-111a-1]